MIADSEYQVNELVLTPVTGILTGLIAAFVMLAVVFLLQPFTGKSVVNVLEQIGLIVTPESSQPALLVGILTHLGVGILCGWLYALSQQQAPSRYLVMVGVFYGLVIWVFSGLVLGIFSEALRLAFRNLSWLIACLAYGASLAALAAWLQIRWGGKAAVTPKD